MLMPRETWVLPDVIDPERVCITLRIPNEPHHIAAFWGNLLSLARWWNWDRDDDHTGARVAAVWWEVFSEANSSFTGDCDVVKFRQPDDCDLEASFDGGVTWQPIFNALACATGAADNQIAQAIDDGILGNGTQPAPGTPPPAQQCWNYHATLSANGKWLTPIPVSDGWTITISNAKGGANDGGVGPLWECPEGTVYTLGLCGANAGTHSGDPIDTLNHMRLIMQVGTDYQDAYNLSYIIPPGTGTVDVVFQANDTVLSDNNGSYEFDLEICNTACHDFLGGNGLSLPSGWTYIFAPGNTGNIALYNSGADRIDGTYEVEDQLIQMAVAFSSPQHISRVKATFVSDRTRSGAGIDQYGVFTADHFTTQLGTAIINTNTDGANTYNVDTGEVNVTLSTLYIDAFTRVNVPDPGDGYLRMTKLEICT